MDFISQGHNSDVHLLWPTSLRVAKVKHNRFMKRIWSTESSCLLEISFLLRNGSLFQITHGPQHTIGDSQQDPYSPLVWYGIQNRFRFLPPIYKYYILYQKIQDIIKWSTLKMWYYNLFKCGCEPCYYYLLSTNRRFFIWSTRCTSTTQYLFVEW